MNELYIFYIEKIRKKKEYVKNRENKIMVRKNRLKKLA
jgi:hypothetical protein